MTGLMRTGTLARDAIREEIGTYVNSFSNDDLAVNLQP